MNRLTEKNKFDTHYGISISKNLLQSTYDKLGQLEDLEEEIGCPLDVVFKALTNGVYYGDNANWMRWVAVDLHINLEGEYVLYFNDEEYLLTKNYKKTWWLKEDRSE